MSGLAPVLADAAPDWDGIDAWKYRDESEAVFDLLARAPLTKEQRAAVRAEAEALVRGARRKARRQGVVEGFLQEFSLGTREGLALMCLAEALLRTPDEGTQDRLIAEKIGPDGGAVLGGERGADEQVRDRLGLVAILPDVEAIPIEARVSGGAHLYPSPTERDGPIAPAMGGAKTEAVTRRRPPFRRGAWGSARRGRGPRSAAGPAWR